MAAAVQAAAPPSGAADASQPERGAAESRVTPIPEDRTPAPAAETVPPGPMPEAEPEPVSKSEPEPEATSAPPAEPANAEDLAARILDAARGRLPRELRSFADDDARFRVRLEGQELILEAQPGFLLDRLKRPEVREIFSTAAREVLQVPVAVRLTERKQEQREKRDLNELRQFKEVTFR